MKFSVIVPVYNVSNYLKECLDSILAQDYDDYEVILVDDGSTDNSGMICDEYAQEHHNVKSFHKKNGGLSDARNYGIEKSSGDFLVFVDSDDYIAKDALNVFSKEIKDSTEVFITRFVEAYPDRKIKRDSDMKKSISKIPSRSEAVKWIMNGSYNTWPAQKYIVSRQFILDNKLTFKKGFLHEDMDWTAHLCILAENHQTSDHIWYFHRMERTDSITNVVKSKRITDIFTIAYDLIYSHNGIQNIGEPEKTIIRNRIMKSVYPALNLCKKIKKSEINMVAKVMTEKKAIFKYAPNMKYKIFSMLINIIGCKNSLKLLRLL